MSSLHSFELAAADGKMIRGDRAEGKDRQILFITGFLSKRWGNKSKALAQWCRRERMGILLLRCAGVRRLRGDIYRLHVVRLDRRCAACTEYAARWTADHHSRQFIRWLDRLDDGPGMLGS